MQNSILSLDPMKNKLEIFFHKICTASAFFYILKKIENMSLLTSIFKSLILSGFFCFVRCID